LARTFSGSSQSFNNLLSGTPSNESPFGVENRTHSWAGWFYWDNSGGSFPAIFSKDDGSGVLTEYMLFIDTSNSKPTWRVSNDGNVLRNVVWSSGITANAWHHFVTTFNADTLAITIQIDGGTPVSAASLGITNTSVTKFNIGQRSDGSLPFKGRVDDLVLIKDRAVTQAEGAAMYNSGKGLSPLDPPASSVDTRSDLKLFYRMEGTLLEYDWSEWGHLGTGSFGQTLVPGKIGTARKFTSTSQDVHTAYDPVLGATPITVTTWVKLDDLTVNLQTYAIKALGSPDFTGWYLRKNNADNQLSATISISGAFTKALGPSDLTAGDWMMLGFTYDGAHLTAYKNGVAGTPVAVAGVIDNVNANITFGRDPAGTDRTVKGIVDDSKIFNRALSSTEMLVLYKQGFRRLTNGGLDLVGPSIILS
jgi:hypothetical protein